MSKESDWIKEYGLKEEIRYGIFLPYFMLKAINGILEGDHKLNGMTKSQYIDLYKGLCDCRAGRVYRWVES